MTHKQQFADLGDALVVRAPAKINLTLLIAGKRPDGFHEIETIMAKVNWYDEILIEYGEKPGIELIVKGPEWAPSDRQNLIYKAAKLLLDNSHSKSDIKLTLTKNIPAGTGLGSASSDAAATLLGLKKFLNLEVSNKNLNQMAAKLGSDVAFFLGGPLAFCTGKGEKIEKITKKFHFLALLVIPKVSVSTKTVYNDYNHNIDSYRALKSKINPNIQKNRIDLAAKMCANMLQTTCFRLYSQLAELKENIESLGIRPLCLSGSGSSMFVVIQDGDEINAKESQRIVAEKIGCKSIIVSDNRW